MSWGRDLKTTALRGICSEVSYVRSYSRMGIVREAWGKTTKVSVARRPGGWAGIGFYVVENLSLGAAVHRLTKFDL